MTHGSSGFGAIICCLAALTAPSLHAQGIGDLHRITNAVSDTALQYRTFQVPPGKEEVLADLKGPGKITYFYFTDNSNGRIHPGIVLKAFWDGAEHPSINVPLADFFGAIAGRTIDFQSQPMQINHLCYMCYLPMPFAKSARIVLANDSDREYKQSVAYGIDYEKDEGYATEASRLHACWRRSNPTDGTHLILEAQGKGHYIGGFLQVFTKYQGWWGEGDTIFNLDGKKITHSPGTEDEYGSCWSFGDKLFQYPAAGYLENKNGQNRMCRWYLANPVRFQRSLKVEVQNQRWADGQVPSRDDYISLAFWYLDQARPVSLAPYAERVAPSKAGEYPRP